MSWWLLHTLAAAFPETPTEARRKSVEPFLIGFAENFPCPLCGTHLREYLDKNSVYPHTKNADSMQNYMYDLHESVNKRKGKPQMHTREEVKVYFISRQSSSHSATSKQHAFNINLPWTPFGGYPIIPSRSLLNRAGLSSSSSLSPQQSSDGGMEKVFLYIIIALAVVLFVIGALAIYFFVQAKNRKIK